VNIGKVIKKVSKKFGTKYQVYSLTGEYIGIEKEFLFPIKRSVDEDIAAFGRTAKFHYKTQITEGCLLVDQVDKEKYYVTIKRSISLGNKLVIWDAFLLQINCNVDFYRKSLVIPEGGHPADATMEFVKIFSDVPCYMQKKDWSMESISQYGRYLRGYETVICPRKDITKGDRLLIGDKSYLIQDIDPVIRENMLELQVGLEELGVVA